MVRFNTLNDASLLIIFSPDKFVSRPYFGDAETVITVQQGEAAFFNCHVFNLANQTVSKQKTLPGVNNNKEKICHCFLGHFASFL